MIAGDLSAILDALDEPVVLVSPDRMITASNVAARELFGDGLVGQPLVRILRQPGAVGCVDSVLEGSERAQATIRIGGPDGATFRVTCVALRGQAASVALTLKDVTPLLQAAQMRTDFVANVSHELRSPLTTLSGIIETLQGAARDDPDAQVRFLATMRREADRMDRLIDDLLSLSRVEQDERVRPTERVDLVALLSRTVGMVQEREESAGVRLAVSASETEAMVAGDSDQLQQVFLNLIENALQYTAGKVDVRLDPLQEPPKDGERFWLLSVRDRGPGIDAEHVPRLTERFYRVDSGRARARGGTGLGLAICKHIVNRHRGRLRIESRVNTGTTVRVVLPALDRVV